MTRYRIMRDCCTAGNCLHCSKHGLDPQPHGQPARVEHLVVEDKQIAAAIADAWRGYNATVIEVSS